jgi:hypothetical protein
MSGLLAATGDYASTLDAESWQQTIKRVDSLVCASAVADEAILCSARHENCPGYDRRLFENDRFIAVYAGDIVNQDEFDWIEICNVLSSGTKDFSVLRRLRGMFALAIYDRSNHVLHAVTDPFAWLPVYCQATDSGVLVSTSLASFLRHPTNRSSASRTWVHQFLFFNYGIGATTPLTDVSRLPAATVTSVDLRSQQRIETQYRPAMTRPPEQLAGSQALARAQEVFHDVVPRYFSDQGKAVLGLSSGLDSRTLLASLPEQALDQLHSFTYGIPGTTELTECQQIAQTLKLQHTTVPLDEEFQNNLHSLARETVFLSDGLQNVNRSHLLHVYRRLLSVGEPYSTLVTGISGDHIFRDHIRGSGNVPHMMSREIPRQNQSGRVPINYEAYGDIFRTDPGEVEDCVETALDEIESTCGEFGDPQSYLSFLMYVVGPRYFSGEAAIANSLATFRNPYWDPEIVALGYELREATLGSSASSKPRNIFKEKQIQAAVIARHPRTRKLKYFDLPINVYASGNEPVYQVHRAFRKIRSVVQRRAFVYGEDWSRWYSVALKDETNMLLDESSRIREFVADKWISKAIATADVDWLGKLLTAEYVLRFIDSGWRLKRQ